MVGLKNSHIRKNLTQKMVNPRDIARYAEEEEEEKKKKKKKKKKNDTIMNRGWTEWHG